MSPTSPAVVAIVKLSYNWVTGALACSRNVFHGALIVLVVIALVAVGALISKLTHSRRLDAAPAGVSTR
jgi:hypothetical protein